MMIARLLPGLWCGLSLLGLGLRLRGEEATSFYREVMPILARSGCNAGACHGNANGKGGLKLSLRGEDPVLDAQTLTRNLPNKRIQPEAPASSYLLRKPTRQISHEGGVKFTAESPEYAVLCQWIRQGARDDTATAPRLSGLRVTPPELVLISPQWSTPLTVEATFADGSTRDVTRWAVYTPANLLVEISPEGIATATREGETTIIVRYLHLQVPVRLAFVADRPNYTWGGAQSVNFIDEAVFAKLRLLKLNPSEICDDVTFLRRVSFDLLGLPPTAEEARQFLADSRPAAERRAALVETMLARPEFGEQWALRWGDLLRNEEKALDTTGVEAYYTWLRDGFNADKPVDQLARELVMGLGSTYTAPAANYYRALRDPATRAEATAQVFLGTRLQCAKCHNHPFEKWTQNDYYRFSALFDGIDYKILSNEPPDKFDKHAFIGEQVVHLEGKREFKDPRTKAAPAPGLLDPAAPAMPHPEGPERLQELANWLTAPTQPLFAKVQANRIWYHLLGTGVVDPVDDFRATNPPSNPALLEALAVAFTQGGMHVKSLVRSILLSRTYQASSVPDATNATDVTNFSHATVRRHTAEQLLDAVHLGLAMPEKFRNSDEGRRAGQLAGVKRKVKGDRTDLTPDDQFLVCFGKPQRLISSELERSNSTSLAQVFTLTSGPGLQELLTSSHNVLNDLVLQAGTETSALVDALCWQLLSRPATAAERGPLSTALEQTADRRQAAEDLAWALLNSKEFLLRK